MGESKVTNMVLRMLGTDVRNEIDNYVNDVCSRNFMVMNSVSQIRDIFGESLDKFLSCLNEEELMYLRSYTGYNFRSINAILRANWTYEMNGILDNQRTLEFKNMAKIISCLLNQFDIPKIDFVTFRGTTLEYFSSYGIKELCQLETLRGRFLYEQGFTSTSLLEETCYFNKELETLENYNIEIKYLIPSESNDGALLLDYNTSYSVNQNEFLLNTGALSKVIDIEVDKDNNTAVLVVVLVPKQIYDRNKTISKAM